MKNRKVAVDCKPSEVHPHASCKGMHTMLGKTTIACLVVSGMEAVLEHGGFDIVSHPLVLWREGFYFPAQFGSGDILLGEVSPWATLFFLPWNAPSLHRDFPLINLGFGFYRFDSFSGLLVNDGQFISFKVEIEPCATLHLAGHKFHFLVPVMNVILGKLPVGRTLTSTVGMELFYDVSCHTLALRHSIFKEIAVSMSGSLHLHAGYKTGLILLSARLGYIGGISLNRMIVLIAIRGIRIVGILKAVGRNLFFGTDTYNSIPDYELLIKYPFEKRIISLAFENIKYGLSKDEKICLHCLGIGTINSLGGIFLQVFFDASAKVITENRKISILEIFAHCLMDKHITGVERNVASNEFAVHPDILARHSISPGLVAGHLLEAFLQQVNPSGGLVFHDCGTEVIICGRAWNILFKSAEAKGLASEKVKLTFFKQLFVAASVSFFEKHHGYQTANRRIRGTIGIVEKHRERVLVNARGHFFVEYVLPCLWVVILLESALSQKVAGIVKQIHLRLFIRFSEHAITCLISLQR